MKDNLLDNLLQQSAAAEVKEAPVESWPVIAAALHKKKRRRAFWLFFLSVLVLSTGIVLFYANGKKENNQPNYAQNNTNTSLEDKIIAKDKPTATNIADTTSVVPKTITSATTPRINDDNDDIVIPQSSMPQKRSRNLYNETRKLEPSKDGMGNGNKNNIPKNKDLSKKGKNIFFEENDENDEVVSWKEDSRVKELSALVMANYKRISFPLAQLDDVRGVKQIKTNSPNSQPQKEKVKPKWKLFYAVTGGVTNVNLLKKSATTTAPSNNFGIGPTNIVQDIPIPTPQYEPGLFFAASMLFKKDRPVKKIQSPFGVTLQYNQFNTKVYRATPAIIFDNAGVLRVDSTVTGNSMFSNKSANGNTTSLKIKNYNIQVGFIAGSSIDLLKINKNQSVRLQVQLVPTFNLSQSINWFDVSTERYFTNKKLNASFNLLQTTSILWEVRKKGRNILIGPNFSYNFFKSNKKLGNLSNVSLSSFGLQMQIGLK